MQNKRKYENVLLSPHSSKTAWCKAHGKLANIPLRENIEHDTVALCHRMSIWERNSHDFYMIGNDSTSKGFTLPNKTTDEVLKETHDFYKALFTKEPDLQPSQDLLCMVRVLDTMFLILFSIPKQSKTQYTTVFITTDVLPPSNIKPLWKSEAWKLTRSIPNDAALSFLWKYLRNVVISLLFIELYWWM